MASFAKDSLIVSLNIHVCTTACLLTLILIFVSVQEAEEQARKAHEAAVIAARFKQQQLLQQQQQARLAALASRSRQAPLQQTGPHSTPTYPPTPSPLTHSNPPSVGGLGDMRGLGGGVDLLNSSPPGYPDMMDTKPSAHNPLLVNLLDNERGLPPSVSSPGIWPFQTLSIHLL